MHDMRWLRDNLDAFAHALQARNWSSERVEAEITRLLSLDDARRQTIAQTQVLQETRNRLSKQVGQAMARKDMAEAEALKLQVSNLKDELASGETQVRQLVQNLEEALAQLPNIPRADVPIGTDERDNRIERVVGTPQAFPAGMQLREHFELGEQLGMMDFERSALMSGARFVILTGGLARLERALGQWMLDLHTQHHGYTEVAPPLLVRDAAMYGTAQLPKFEEDQFWALSGEALKGDTPLDPAQLRAARYGLIPTAEVPLTNLVRESMLKAETLPLRFTALTPCFRSEAGAAGRDTRGMIRLHQFSKVELVSITHPESSQEEHERMTNCAEEVLRQLGLHYRVVTLCTGDMGFGAQKTYDLEVWLPGQNAFREISSCSSCGDFQARRMQARAQIEGTAPFYVHTLNGSGVAVGRALIAVMETYQNEDGSITIPEVLRPYMGGLTRLNVR